MSFEVSGKFCLEHIEELGGSISTSRGLNGPVFIVDPYE